MGKMDKVRVLIVDDITDTRENLRKLLFFEKDIEVVGGVGRGEEGIQKARELRPDVVLMDINLPGMDGIAATEAIRSQAPSTQVIMMSVQGESEYLRRAMLAGAREFLVKPFGSEELASSIRRVHALARDTNSPLPAPQPASQPGIQVEGQREKGEIFSIYSAKGGVGRTTVACNLAVALKNITGKKVVLVDASLQFGDVAVVLNAQGSKTIVDLTRHLDNLEPELIDGVLATHSSGVRLLLAPPRPEMAELITADAMKGILNKLRECYDYVVVDTAAGFHDTVLAALDVSDRIILLFTLEMPSIKNAKTFIQIADALEYPADKLLLVLNRVDGVGGIQPSDVEESLRQRIPIKIVSDARLATYALNRGIPFVVSNAESPLAKGIFTLAELVARVQCNHVLGTSEAVEAKAGHSPLSRLQMPIKLAFRRHTVEAVSGR